MPSQEDINHQLRLLEIHRRNLAHLVKQAAHYGGEDETPVYIANSLQENRDNIRRIKGILRGWGTAVVDGPNDEPPDMADSSSSVR
ncbi:MAG TPA: hypothetical protein VKE41_12820 [Roseiflexaceae bacterium]|nr:hypothetical protein [Roseiflexaceae bacterium]